MNKAELEQWVHDGYIEGEYDGRTFPEREKKKETREWGDTLIKQRLDAYNGGWIPCAERLPEDGTEVLVYSVAEDGFYFEGTSTLINGGWWIGSETCPLEFITHWQPLPDGPDIKE